jgi:hypothetical protein
MKLHHIALALTAASLSVWPAIAEEPSAVINISREAIKEGRSAAHEKVETDWARAFRKAKFPYHWMGMTPMTGVNEVWFINFYSSFADMEKADKQVESTALKNESELLDARDGEMRTGTRTVIATYRKDLSYHADQAVLGKTRYGMLTVYQVRLGHMEEFLQGAKTYMAGVEKSGYPLPILCYEVVAGSHDGTFHFFTPLESLAPLDSMHDYDRKLAQALGPDAMSKLEKSMGDIFSSVESTYFKVNPNMSYLPAEVEAADPDYWRPKTAPAPKPAAPKPAAAAKPGQ